MACVITSCKNNRRTLPVGTDVTFHRLHDEPAKTLRKWLGARGSALRSRNVIVCSDHFSSEDFVGDPRRLKPNAVLRYMSSNEKRKAEGGQEDDFKRAAPDVKPVELVDLTAEVADDRDAWLQHYYGHTKRMGIQMRQELRKREYLRYPGDCDAATVWTMREGVNSLNILNRKLGQQRVKLGTMRRREFRLDAKIAKGKATIEVLGRIVSEQLTDREFVEGLLDDILPGYAKGFKDDSSDSSDDDLIA